MDIASLGIKVQTQGVKEADQQLDSFAKTSERAEQSVKSAAGTINKGFKPDTAGIKAQREELAKLVGQIDPAVAALDKLDKQEQKLRAFRAKGLVDSGTFANLTQTIDSNRQALSRFTANATSAGLSAKQLAQATRQLPMQFTDIFTSLASGQRPMQVLLQQGGQLKDVFGGVGPAIRAMGGYLLGLVNPLTVSVGLVAALGLAWKQGSDEAVGFNRALALTGNYAGTTTAQLEAMSVALVDANTTQHQAAQALAEVTQSGKFTADQLQAVTRAAIDMQKATGQAVEQTVKEFASLADDPVNAVVKLNEKYHFLTAAVYDQIKALQQQGREQEAATLAVQTFARVSSQRAKEAVESAGFIERAWDNVGRAVRSVWSDILSIGRQSTAQADAQLKIQSAVSQLRANSALLQAAADRSRNGGTGFTNDQIALYQRDTERLRKVIIENQRKLGSDPGIKKAQQDAANQRANDAIIAIRQVTDAHATAEQQRANRITQEIAQADNAILQAQKSGSKQLLDEAKAAKTALLKAQADEEAARVKPSSGGGGGRASAAPRVREMPDFSNKASEEVERLAEVEARATESFRDRIAVLQGPLAEAEREHIRRVQELQALAAQSPEAADGLNRALELEAKRHAQVAKEIEAQQNPLKLLLDDMKFELDVIGKSNAERSVMIELRRLNINAMSAEGQAAIETAKTFEKEAEAKQKSIALMDEFRSGASDALADIITGAKSAKDAFADFFNDLTRRLIQMATDRLIEKAFGSFGSDGGGTSGGNWLMQAASAFFGGGRASGGSVSANKLYEVGEHNRPELLQMQGRSYLIPGNQGKVMPFGGNPQTRLGSFVMNQVIQVQGRMDRSTPEQIARLSGRDARRGMARTGG